MRARAVFGTVLALGLAGCGQAASTSRDFEGEAQAVADRVADLSEDAQRRRPAEICDQILARELREQIAAGGSSCADEMEKAIEDADGLDLEVTDVSVTGDTATATVRSTDRGEDVTREFELVREGSGWRIAGFGGG